MGGETGEIPPRRPNPFVVEAKQSLDELILTMGGVKSAEHKFTPEQEVEGLNKGKISEEAATDVIQISQSEQPTDRFNLTEFLSNPANFSDFVGFLSHSDVAGLVWIARSLPRKILKILVVRADGSVNNYRFGGWENRTNFKRGIDGPISFYQSRVEEISKGANNKISDGAGSELYFNIRTQAALKSLPEKKLIPDPLSIEMNAFITQTGSKMIEERMKAPWATRLARAIRGIMPRRAVETSSDEQKLADEFRKRAETEIDIDNPENPTDEISYHELTAKKIEVARLALKVLGVIPFDSVQEIDSLIKSGEEVPTVSYGD